MPDIHSAEFIDHIQAIIPDAVVTFTYQDTPSIQVPRILTHDEMLRLEEYLALAYQLRPIGRPLN